MDMILYLVRTFMCFFVLVGPQLQLATRLIRLSSDYGMVWEISNDVESEGCTLPANDPFQIVSYRIILC